MRRLLACLAIVGASLSSGHADATGIGCQTTRFGTYTASSSCTKTDNLMFFKHRVHVICQSTSNGSQWAIYGPWKATLLSGNPNWSTVSCPQGSFRANAWADWTQI